MSYTSLCKYRNLGEGDMVAFNVDGREILLVWPKGGELKAFQGTCPHHNGHLKYGGFDGRTIRCTFHDWVFDARTGRGVIPPHCSLAEYPLRIEDGVVQVALFGCSPA